jgi:hypothetical protein
MSRTKRLGLAAGTLASALLLGGCHAAGDHATASAAAAAPSTQALACDTCRVTYVQVPVGGGKGSPGITGYRSAKRMECPDCKSAAANFFATGKFEHTCKTCGPTMEICKAH